MLEAAGFAGAARAEFDGGVSSASREKPREGQQGTGWVGHLLTGLRVPGACRGEHPLDRWSLHLLGKDVSQPMAGPGAPSRPPPSGASPAGLSRRPPYAGARARPHRLPRTCRVPLCSPRAAASTAAPARAHRPRSPPPIPRVRRGAVRGAGGAAIRAEGAAWGQRAPRARPPPPPEPPGACARRGRGARACVCVGAGGTAARWLSSLRGSRGPGPGDRKQQEGILTPNSPITSSTFLNSFHSPPPFHLPKPLPGKLGLAGMNSLQLTPGQEASHVF